jgi:hypothetical protein
MHIPTIYDRFVPRISSFPPFEACGAILTILSSHRAEDSNLIITSAENIFLQGLVTKT